MENNCTIVNAEKLTRNSTLVVFIKLGNSRDDGGKSESHTVFHRWFVVNLAFFVLYRRRASSRSGILFCSYGEGDYVTTATIQRFCLKNLKCSYLYSVSPRFSSHLYALPVPVESHRPRPRASSLRPPDRMQPVMLLKPARHIYGCQIDIHFSKI